MNVIKHAMGHVNPEFNPDRREVIRNIGAGTIYTIALSNGLLSGCATISIGKTSPNNSLVDKLNYVPKDKALQMRKMYHDNPDKYLGVIPALMSFFDQNGKEFSEIAYQLGQLPEWHDKITPQEVQALDELVGVYQEIPEQFEGAFEQMDAVGIKDVRKYNSPLQAVFWLAHDGELQSDIFGDYSLKKTLNEAWPKEGHDNIIFTEEEKETILKGIKNPRYRSQYKVYFKDFDQGTINAIKWDLKHENRFNWSARSTIKSAFKRARTGDPRWGDFSTVMNRLNAPELVDHYIDEEITYERHPSSVTRCQSAGVTFSKKTGDCACAAIFGQNALSRSGYKTFMRMIWGTYDTHVGLVVKHNNQYSLAVNFTTSSLNALSGPFKDKSVIDSILSKSTGPIRKRGYFTNYR